MAKVGEDRVKLRQEQSATVLSIADRAAPCWILDVRKAASTTRFAPGPVTFGFAGRLADALLRRFARLATTDRMNAYPSELIRTSPEKPIIPF